LTENESFYEKEAFSGPEYAENEFAAGASPWIPLAELTTLPQIPYSAAEGHPSQTLP